MAAEGPWKDIIERLTEPHRRRVDAIIAQAERIRQEAGLSHDDALASTLIDRVASLEVKLQELERQLDGRAPGPCEKHPSRIHLVTPDDHCANCGKWIAPR